MCVKNLYYLIILLSYFILKNATVEAQKIDNHGDIISKNENRQFQFGDASSGQDEYFQYEKNYTKFVNSFIGTTNGGNTNPGAVMPWGMASIAPFNAYDTLVFPGRYPSPYVDGGKYISGFTNVGLSPKP